MTKYKYENTNFANEFAEALAEKLLVISRKAHFAASADDVSFRDAVVAHRDEFTQVYSELTLALSKEWQEPNHIGAKNYIFTAIRQDVQNDHDTVFTSVKNNFAWNMMTDELVSQASYKNVNGEYPRAESFSARAALEEEDQEYSFFR